MLNTLFLVSLLSIYYYQFPLYLLQKYRRHIKTCQHFQQRWNDKVQVAGHTSESLVKDVWLQMLFFTCVCSEQGHRWGCSVTSAFVAPISLDSCRIGTSRMFGQVCSYIVFTFFNHVVEKKAGTCDFVYFSQYNKEVWYLPNHWHISIKTSYVKYQYCAAQWPLSSVYKYLWKAKYWQLIFLKR